MWAKETVVGENIVEGPKTCKSLPKKNFADLRRY